VEASRELNSRRVEEARRRGRRWNCIVGRDPTDRKGETVQKLVLPYGRDMDVRLA